MFGLCITTVAHALADLRRRPTQAEESGYGAHPDLPKPKPTLIPIMKIAPAVGWPAGAKPTPAAGLAVRAFAAGLDHPRWVYDSRTATSSSPKAPRRRALRAWEAFAPGRKASS